MRSQISPPQNKGASGSRIAPMVFTLRESNLYEPNPKKLPRQGTSCPVYDPGMPRTGVSRRVHFVCYPDRRLEGLCA
jgi:hypothetical protein